MSQQSSSSPGVTKELCSWIHGLRLDDVPESVRTRAKYLILDGLCCALVGAHLPWVEKAAKAIFAIEPQGDSIVWGYNKVCGNIYLVSKIWQIPNRNSFECYSYRN